MRRLLSQIFLILVTYNIALGSAYPADDSRASRASSYLSTVNHIVLDARGNRGGNGDVAASYLLIRELTEHFQYHGQITVLVNESELEILSRLAGKKLQHSERIASNAQIVVMEMNNAALSPSDLYIQLASSSKIITPDLVRMTSSHSKAIISPNQIPITTNATLVRQTVLGFTEGLQDDRYGRAFKDTAATVQIGTTSYLLPPPGLNQDFDMGVYFDAEADRFQKMSASEKIDEVLRTADTTQATIAAVVKKEALKNSKLSLAYGIWNDYQQQQFGYYLKGIHESLGTQAVVFISPLNLKPENIPPQIRPFVTFLDAGQPIPVNAEPGRIYFLKTGFMPHKLFTGLIAISEIPPVIAGDNALSAALQLRTPFVMTMVPWNEANIAELRESLLRGLDGDDARSVRSIFSTDHKSLTRMERGLEVTRPNISRRFSELYSDDTRFALRLFSSIEELKTLNSRRPEYRMLQPYLHHSLPELRIAAAKKLISSSPIYSPQDLLEFQTVLNAMLRNEPRRFKLWLVEALVNDSKSLAPLLPQLRTALKDPDITVEVLHFLTSRKSTVDRAVWEFIFSDEGFESYEKHAAYFYDSSQWNPETIEIALQALKNTSNDKLRMWISSSLGRSSNTDPSKYLQLLTHRNPRVRIAGLGSLPKKADATFMGSIMPAYIENLAGSDRAVAEAAEHKLQGADWRLPRDPVLWDSLLKTIVELHQKTSDRSLIRLMAQQDQIPESFYAKLEVFYSNQDPRLRTVAYKWFYATSEGRKRLSEDVVRIMDTAGTCFLAANVLQMRESWTSEIVDRIPRLLTEPSNACFRIILSELKGRDIFSSAIKRQLSVALHSPEASTLLKEDILEFLSQYNATSACDALLQVPS